jgi:hypothetical protein
MRGRLSTGLLGLGLLAVAACGGVKEEALPNSGNSLTGRVTYKGQPLQFAAIVITGAGGTGGGALNQDGTYRADNLPLGEVKIGVDTDAARGDFQSVVMAASYKGPDANGAGKAPKFVSVPAKFADPEASGLTTTIKPGANTFDIDIP